MGTNLAMQVPFELTFSNYRSFSDPVKIRFDRRITFVVGPNNAGKSNILRFLAILFNKAYNTLNIVRDFPNIKKEISIEFELRIDFIEKQLATTPRAFALLKKSTAKSIPIGAKLTDSKIDYMVPSDRFFDIIPRSYFENRSFLDDFRTSSSIEDNIKTFISRLKIEDTLLGTAYIPHYRFIADKDVSIFRQLKFPGISLGFNSIIQQLAQMDRPTFETLPLELNLQKICKFMEFVLEKDKISIQVSSDQSDIIVRIDDVPRSISDLGTGVEQVLIIGLASFGFSNKLVLIEEPELHLHPRAQKRIITYLDDVSDSQFVIATHSAACLDVVDANILHVYQKNNNNHVTLVQNNSDRFRAVRDLGHSPSELIQTRFAIWVEGPSDRVYINYWIHEINEILIEGVDYSVIFYGGRILSHHGFDDVEADLVRAISLSRNFAVVIDSDRPKPGARLNATKIRVREEVERQEGYCWITDGREIENYVPLSVVGALAGEFKGVNLKAGKHDHVLDSDAVNKVEFARRACELPLSEWLLDLRTHATELVRRIEAAR